MPRPKTLDYDYIEKLYGQGLDKKTIATRLGCSPASITRILQERGYKGDGRRGVAGTETGPPSELNYMQWKNDSVEGLI